MTMAKSEFSRRFTGSEMLQTIPAKQAVRDFHANNVAAFLASGGKIEVVQSREYDLIRPRCKYIEHDESKPSLTREQAAKWLKITDPTLSGLIRAGFAPKRHTGKVPREYLYSIVDLREWKKANAENPFPHPAAAKLAGMLDISTVAEMLGYDPRNDVHRKLVTAAAVMGCLKVGMALDASHGKKTRFFWPKDVEAYKRQRNN